MQCYVATSNQGKLSEIVSLGKIFFPKIKEWIGRAPKEAEEVEDSFLGNAKIKSSALREELIKEGKSNFWVLADDSGIEVEALDWRPGVHSARYAGDHVAPIEHIKKLLSEMQGKKQRAAQYHCALSLIIQTEGQGSEFYGEGLCRGEIIEQIKGNSGFGYDPIFFVKEFNKTMAELDGAIKNEISHRYRAFEKLTESLGRFSSIDS